MCCNLQTHVRVIAIICITLTGLGGFLSLFAAITPLVKGSQIYSGYIVWIVVQIVITGVQLVSYILCLIGSNKRNKWLLIPFMILTSLHIPLCIILEIYIIPMFFEGLFGKHHPHGMGGLLAAFLFPLIIALLIAVGLSIYFLTIVIKFYNEISSGIISGEQQGMVLQSYNTPQTAQQGGGVAIVYVPPATQTVVYQYPQQPPSNPYTQQGYGYHPNNAGMQNPS